MLTCLGRHYWAKRTAESCTPRLIISERAIKFDPGYALAYSGLADTWGVLTLYYVRAIQEE